MEEFRRGDRFYGLTFRDNIHGPMHGRGPNSFLTAVFGNPVRFRSFSLMINRRV